ncbi:recombinase family protein [Streptomyces sp. SID13726]|uniref:recombinase family protein n=1 Tax=Streptomyces sp. SID13726 TaxID=2706058 RepID=UPI0013BA4865|nr:recombinase family protein [Streptomyces sp. SID13726]NEB04526.1 recombinase family protein [Streptomyces sp. SID13726]
MGQSTLIRPNLPQSVALAQLCVSYGRVSLDEQKTGKGVASQHTENEDFALEDVGRAVERHYSDIGISAFAQKRERPGFQDLLRDIEAGLITIVIVWHADRLTRDTSEADEFIRLCVAKGATLWSQQRGGPYNFKRAAGRADFKRDIVKAEEESAHKGERVSLSHKRRALNGEWGGGVRPFGWGVDTGRVRSKCINPRADIADRVYENVPVLDMTQHRPNERDEIRSWKKALLGKVPVNQVLLSLNRRKVPTVSETDGRKVTRRGKNVLTGRWSRETLFGILTSPRVAGHAVWRGEIVKWNAFDPIITEDERQALITLFADPSRKTTTGNTPKWLGSLIYLCERCLGPGVTAAEIDKIPEHERPYMRQRCKTPGTSMPLYLCNVCDKGRQPAPLLDTYIAALIVERLSRPDLIELVSPQGEEIDVEGLRNEQAVLIEKRTQLAVMFAETDPDKPSIDAAQLQTGNAKINARLRAISATLTEAVGESPLKDFVTAHETAEQVWGRLELGPRREIVRLMTYVVCGQAPRRKPGKRAQAAPAEELDYSTITVIPRQ